MLKKRAPRSELCLHNTVQQQRSRDRNIIFKRRFTVAAVAAVASVCEEGCSFADQCRERVCARREVQEVARDQGCRFINYWDLQLEPLNLLTYF